MTRWVGALTICFTLPLANMAAAGEQSVHSADDFVVGTSSCLSGLAAGSPEKVLASLEGEGWKLEKASTLGGTFRKDKQSVRLEFQNLFGSYVCTVFGNRAQPGDGLLFTDQMQNALALKFAGGIAEGKTKAPSEFSYVINGRFTVVVTLDGVNGGFNTKVTTIEAPK